MPTKSSLADTMLEADQALASVVSNADLLPSVEKYRAPLEEAVTELKGLSTRQQTLIADKQKVTQDLKAAARRVKDLLIIRGRNIYPQDIEDSVRDVHPMLRPGGVAAFAVDAGEGRERGAKQQSREPVLARK